jgi:hypothetical protein
MVHIRKKLEMPTCYDHTNHRYGENRMNKSFLHFSAGYFVINCERRNVYHSCITYANWQYVWLEIFQKGLLYGCMRDRRHRGAPEHRALFRIYYSRREKIVSIKIMSHSRLGGESFEYLSDPIEAVHLFEYFALQSIRRRLRNAFRVRESSSSTFYYFVFPSLIRICWK